KYSDADKHTNQFTNAGSDSHADADSHPDANRATHSDTDTTRARASSDLKWPRYDALAFRAARRSNQSQRQRQNRHDANPRQRRVLLRAIIARNLHHHAPL